MIESLHAHVARTAVDSARWPIELARRTELHLVLAGLDVNWLVLGHRVVRAREVHRDVVGLLGADGFVGRGPGQEARIAECAHDVARYGQTHDQEANDGHHRIGVRDEEGRVEADVEAGRYENEREHTRHDWPIAAGVTAAIAEELSLARKHLPVRY